MLKFQRNTHDDSGVYRGDAYFGIIPKLSTCGVQTFMGSGPQHSLTLEQYVAANQEYQRQLPEENPNGIQDTATLTKLSLTDLAIMLQYKLVVLDPSSTL